jgi:hypothetical protein
MRSLYLRLFVVFTIVLLVSLGAFWLAYVIVSGPAIRRMIGGSQAAQADEAAAFMQRGGTDAVRDYLRRLEMSRRWRTISSTPTVAMSSRQRIDLPWSHRGVARVRRESTAITPSS